MRYVGLDVHKQTVRVCVLDAAGHRVLGKTVPCTRESLLSLARETLSRHDQVALEATTNTWAVVDILQPHVAAVTVSNPLRTKAIAEAKIKTDKVDAEVWAQLLRCDYLPPVWEPDDKTRTLREVTGYRTTLVADRTRIKNRIQGLLAQRLIKPPMSAVFGRAGLAWLRDLDLAEEDRRVVDSQLRLLAEVEKEFHALDKRLQASAYRSDEARLLMTLPGVSHGTALALLAALGDISRFRDGDHAASYLGLAPSTRQSADHCYHGHITKAGDANARWMLTQGVQHIANHPGPLGVFFRRLAKRKNRNVAISAVARKLVTIAYLMLKNKEPYRYALPKRVHEKFTHLRTVASGTPAKPVKAKPTTLPAACAGHDLPPIRTFPDLPPGERKMLQARRLDGVVRDMHGVKPPRP